MRFSEFQLFIFKFKELQMNKLLTSLLFFSTKFSVIESGAGSAEDKLETAPTKYIETNGIKFS